MFRTLKQGIFDNVILSPRPGRAPIHGGGLAYPASYPKYCRHRRNKRYIDDILDVDSQTLPILKPENNRPYIWGGVYQWHFGHTLAEFVHRLWVLEQQNLSDATVLFVMANGQSYATDFFKQIMTYLKVEKWQILTEPCVISRLLIAEQGKSLGRKSHPHYTAYLSRLAEKHGLIDANWPQKKDKVAILRGHLSGRRYLGEQHLANYLAEQGYHIFESEKYPIDVQLKTIANAQKIIISDGSACHLMDLLPKINAEVAFLARSSSARLGKASLKPKAAKVYNFKKAQPLIIPKTEDGKPLKTKALLYADMDKIIDFLKRNRFLGKEAPNITPVASHTDINDYLDKLGEGKEYSITNESLFAELYK